MNISHFNTPDPTVKTVLVYLNGIYDETKNIYPEKDLALPMRLYPNAQFAIRCDCSPKGQMKNYKFFSRLYKGRKFKLIPDNQIWGDLKCDVVWYMVDYVYIFFGGVMDKVTFNKYMVTQQTSAKVHILFNDEVTKKYEPLWNYVQRRTGNFLEVNKEMISQLKEKKDWSNVTLICNQDMFSQWVNDRVIEPLRDTINISYLSDKILYDLPDMKSLKPTVSNHFCSGIFVGRFTPPRIKFWNAYMGGTFLDLKIFGPDSDKLKYHTGDGKPVANGITKEMYSSTDYAYSIYFGKGGPSAYLGATFYEPILLGKPVFVWIGTDPKKKLFPNLDCYFNTAEDLYKLIEIVYTSPDKLIELWKQQCDEISKW